MAYQYDDNHSYGAEESAGYSNSAANVIAAGGASLGSSVAIGPQSFEGYVAQEPGPIDIASIQLPPPNMACYQEPPQPRPEVKFFKVDEAPVTKSITQNFNTSKTVVKENTIHTQHIKNVIINVTRNHWHTQRVVVKDTNYHHYLINNVIKVADVHHQKIEQVRGESKNFNDYKQTQRVEAAECVRGQDSVGQISGGAAALTSADESAVASLVASAGNASSAKTTTTTTAFGTGSSQAYTASSGASYGANYGSSGSQGYSYGNGQQQNYY
jgi:hypothetical protein